MQSYLFKDTVRPFIIRSQILGERDLCLLGLLKLHPRLKSFNNHNILVFVLSFLNLVKSRVLMLRWKRYHVLKETCIIIYQVLKYISYVLIHTSFIRDWCTRQGLCNNLLAVCFKYVFHFDYDVWYVIQMCMALSGLHYVISHKR